MVKLEIAGVHAEVDKKLEKYVIKKVGQLDRYLPRRIRPSLHAEVKLKEDKALHKNACTCEVILHLPKDTLRLSESTVNMYAAVDIVEAKLKIQLKKYKERRTDAKLYRSLVNRIRRKTA